MKMSFDLAKTIMQIQVSFSWHNDREEVELAAIFSPTLR
jgi:hypothetical protein